MSRQFFLRAAAVGVILLGAAGAANAGGHAKSSGHPGVDERQALMKEIGGSMKTIKGFVTGEGGTAGDVAAAASAMSAAAGKIDGVFNDEIHVENAGDVKTTASPAIWQKRDEFKAVAASLEADASALAATAVAGDNDAIRAGFGKMAKNCGACHKPFRVKK